MSKVRFTLNMVAVAVFMLTVSSMANAQATRTWVSGVGDDVNPCSRTAPCKTYAGAISKTAKDGEISTLDPGGFGTVTITKSITINGTPGAGYGSILSALAPQGVLINITDAADVRKTVRLNWLDINGASTGTNGVRFIAGNALHIENCVLDGFTDSGVNLNASSQAVNQLHMRNVSIRNVANGVNIANTSTNATQMSLDNVSISKASSNCLNAGNGSRGQVANSFFSSCTNAGINATQSTSATDIAVNDSAITASGTGIATGASTHVRIARVVITGNGNALGTGGSVDTGGNNTIMGNGVNQDPNGTLFIQK
jgi:hypothetical protein